MSAARPHGLRGPRVLVVANGPVDLDRFRKRRYDRLVVVHAREDGTFDERVQPSFARALIAGDTTDAAYVRAAADFATARLESGGRIEFVDPAGDPAAALVSIATALPHLDVSVTKLPAPARATVVEAALGAAAERKRSFLRRLGGRP